MTDISSNGKINLESLGRMLLQYQCGLDVDYRCQEPGPMLGYSFLGILMRTRDYENAYHFLLDYHPNCFVTNSAYSFICS